MNSIIQTVILGLVVIVITILDEVLIVLYTQKVAKHKMMDAAILSIFIEIISIAFFWIVLNNFIAILFGIIGAFVGTLYANKLETGFNKLRRKIRWT